MKKYITPLLAAILVAFTTPAWAIWSNGGGGPGSGGGSNVTIATPTPVAGQFWTGPPSGVVGVTIGGDTQCSVAGNSATCTNIGLNGYTVIAATPTIGCMMQGVSGNQYACITPTATPTPIAANLVIAGPASGAAAQPAARALVGADMPPLTFWAGLQGNTTQTDFCGGGGAACPNKSYFWTPEYIPTAITFSKIGIRVQLGDGSNNYDWGLMTPAGVLLAEVGAQHLTVGYQNIGIIQNAACTGSHTPAQCCTGASTGTCPVTVTIPPGYYSLVSAADSATGQIFFSSVFANAFPVVFYGASATCGATSGGIVPASCSAIALSPTATVQKPWFWLD